MGTTTLATMQPTHMMMVTLVSLVSETMTHLHPHARTKRSDEGQIQGDKAHLSEELEEAFNKEAIENMTAEERDFHYFRIHDFDKNNLLDGLEVFKALVHESEHEKNETEQNSEAEKSFDDIVEMIDKVLEEDDTNKDGFLSYSEFVAGRRRVMGDVI